MAVFRIWFQPTGADTGYYVDYPEPTYPTRVAAERKRGEFAEADNPAWKGVFSVVELIDGRPV